MLQNRKPTFIAFLFSVSLLFSACAAPTPVPTSQSALPTGPDAVWHLVVIGDSSLWGLTKAFAAQIEKDVGVKVMDESFALGGLSAGAVLQALETGQSSNPKLGNLPDALSDADVVVMFVNPLDSIDPEKPLDFEGCFGFKAPASCPPSPLRNTRLICRRFGQTSSRRVTASPPSCAPGCPSLWYPIPQSL